MRVFRANGSEVTGTTTSVAVESAGSFTLENPVAGDKFTVFVLKTAQTITRLESFVRGSASPSVTWTLKKGVDPSGAGTEVIIGGKTSTSTSAIEVWSAFDSPGVGADNAVWVEISAQSGTVKEFHLTICM